jgi:hypothetical protein
MLTCNLQGPKKVNAQRVMAWSDRSNLIVANRAEERYTALAIPSSV